MQEKWLTLKNSELLGILSCSSPMLLSSSVVAVIGNILQS